MPIRPRSLSIARRSILLFALRAHAADVLLKNQHAIPLLKKDALTAR